MYQHLRKLCTTQRQQSDLRPRTKEQADWGQTVEVLEQRVVLSTTSFPQTVSASPGVGAPQHFLTFESVSGDPNNDGVITNGDQTPNWTVTLSVLGSTNPSHRYRLDLRDGGTVVASSGNRLAGSSTANLPLTATSAQLGFSETTLTARLHNVTNGTFFDFNNAVTVRVNRAPTTQNQSYDVFSGTDMNLLDLGVSDPDGDDFTVRIDSTPTGGLFRENGSAISAGQTLNLNSDRVRYTPAAMSGTDSFQFSVTDSPGNTSPQRTATINLVPPPIGTPQLAPVDDTGQDRDGDGNVDPEPVGLMINGITVDRVTSVTSDLTFSFDSPAADAVQFRAKNLATMTVTTANGSQSGGTFTADLNLAPGTYEVTAVSTLDSSSVESSPVTINVDVTDPAAPGAAPQNSAQLSTNEFLASNRTLTFDISNMEEAGLLIVERADQNSGVFNEIAREFPATANGIVTNVQNTVTEDGTFDYRFKQIDIAGNDPPTTITVFVDATDPIVSPLALTSGTVASPLVNAVTPDTSPNVEVTISEQRFSGTDHTLTSVQLFERLSDGTEVMLDERMDVVIPQGPDGLVDITVALESNQALAAGNHTLFVRVTDAAGNTDDSADLTISIFIPQGPTLDSPSTPVFTEYFNLRDLKDTAGNDLFDVQGDGDNIQVWQMSFDKSTQTIWMNLERGRGTLQFDPATGTVNYFDYAEIFNDAGFFATDRPTDVGASVGEVVDAKISNPHGLFFDFNSHVNPRVWVVHRNADRLDDAGTPLDPTDDGLSRVGASGRGRDNGRLSYLDLVTGELVSYDLEEALSQAGLDPDSLDNVLNDLHAIVVDARGTVWIAAANANKVIEVDFDDPSVTSSINSRSAKVIVHELPPDLVDVSTTQGEFHPHGLDVIVDDETGEAYVWMVDVEGSGRVALLRPGAGIGNEDVWTTWDMPNQDLNGNPIDLENARVPFIKVDDNESPGDPRDDRIVFMAPVERRNLTTSNVSSRATLGLVYVFDPGLSPENPTEFTNGRLRAYRLQAEPGASSSSGLAAVNQPFVDREGGIYWADRLTGTGRIDLSEATLLVDEQLVPLTDFIGESSSFDIAGPSEEAFVTPRTAILPPPTSPGSRITVTGSTDDRSNNPGVDQYAVSLDPSETGPGRSSGRGLFRGAINAANTLYGSNTRLDQVSLTVFAETPRRQMSVVRLTPDDQIAEGIQVEDRMAFQTIRTTDQNGNETGAVIMTFRENGQILDDQINLTQLLAKQTGKSVDELGFNSDPSAVVANGQVHVVGTAKDGLSINRYRFDIATATWSYDSFGAPDNGVLAGEPQALVDDDGNLVVAVTNSLLNPMTNEIEGHLLVNTFDSNGDLTADFDLTTLSGGDPAHFVYGNPAAIAGDNMIYFYGVDQNGSVVEYVFDTSGAPVVTASTIATTDPNGHGERATRILQSVYAREIDGERRLFGFDGTSRLVHYRITADATGGTPTQAVAENVTILAQANSPTGYFADFQAGFEARAYPEIAILIDPIDSTVHVYGTNGGELVEFISDGSQWTARNLSNDTAPNDATRVSANSVFGAPDAYIGLDGNRHILQTNAEGEVVEYVFDRTLMQFDEQTGQYAVTPRYTTRNINLANGNEVQDLRRVETPTTIAIGGGPALAEVDSDPVSIIPAADVSNPPANFGDIILSARIADGLIGDLLSIPNQGIGAGQIGVAGSMVTYEGTNIGTRSFEGAEVPDKLRVDLNANANAESVEALLRALSFSTMGEFGLRTVEISLLNGDGEAIGDRVAKVIGVVPAGTLDFLDDPDAPVARILPTLGVV